MHPTARKFCAAVALAVLTLLGSLSAFAGPSPAWPQYGFDARHTMFEPFERILNRSNVAGLTLEWEFMTGNGVGIAPLSGPAVARGVIYVASIAQTTFTALDAATGASRWVYTGTSNFSDPAIGDGYVYTASLDGNLYAFPTSCDGTCAPAWAAPVGALGTNSPPTLSDGKIYIGGYDGRVYAFDATSGAELWSGQVNPPIGDPLNFAPAVSGDKVFVAGDRGIYAFPGSCSTPCTPLWISRTEFSPSAAPAVAGTTVLVADYQGTIYAIDAATGASKWKGNIAAIPHAIAVARGVAYLASGRGELVAYAVAGCGSAVCGPLWKSKPSGFTLFTPTVANGVVYVGALDFIYTQGDVLAYPANCSDGCRPLATIVLGGANETPVAVAGGRIYATTVNGNIDSFGLVP
ncbi:MAG: PQQ-binding-like beta-propeller repeat protein [Chthoniobacterales bacterium]